MRHADSPRRAGPGLVRVVQGVDWMLLGVVVCLMGVGVYNLYSAALVVGKAYHILQAVTCLAGLVVAGGMSLVDKRVFEQWAHVTYAGVLVLLGLVMVFGTKLNGSTRWLDLGAFMLQPSELLKIGVILITAKFFQDRDRDEPYSLRALLKLFALVGLGVGFVLLQPDLGTSLAILAIMMTMVCFEGIRLSSVVILMGAALLSIPFVWTFGMKGYQQDRVMTFLNREEDQQGQAWQVRQSIIAFGSGRIWGKGHTQGTQIQSGFVPEHENDFAAATWAEEHGLMGMLLLLLLYAALIASALRVAARSQDRFGAHLGVGMAAFFFWHVFVNLGMVTGMLPVVGLPLPLMSYGRSNLMTVMLGVGLLMSTSVASRPRR